MSQTTGFATGTLVQTARGPVPVEALLVGEDVITASGAQRTVQAVECIRAEHAGSGGQALAPIRIGAGALGGGKPRRDLLLSPHHPLALTCVQDILVPARCLANGQTVRADAPDKIAYWHVALDSHDVILAEGLPVASRPDAELCMPLVESGPILTALRATLFGEAATPETPSPQAVHLVVDGVAVMPQSIASYQLAFFLPDGAQEIRLVSPIHNNPPDIRWLGVSLSRIVFSNASDEPREIRLDDRGLVGGFHKVECGRNGAWRWTSGDAHLAASLWEGMRDPLTLTLNGDFNPERSKT